MFRTIIKILEEEMIEITLTATLIEEIHLEIIEIIIIQILVLPRILIIVIKVLHEIMISMEDLLLLNRMISVEDLLPNLEVKDF